MKYFTKEYYKAPKEEVSAKYKEEFNRNFQEKTPFMKFFDTLHDCDIYWIKTDGDEVYFRIGHEGCGAKGFSDIIFKNTIVKKQDFELMEASTFGWCYHEIYPSDRGYELHVLFYRYGYEEPYEFVFEFESVEITDKSDYLYMRVIAKAQTCKILFSRLEILCEKHGFTYAVIENEPYWKTDEKLELVLEFGPCPIFSYDEWSDIFHFLFRLDHIVEWDYNDDIDFGYCTEDEELDVNFVYFRIPEKCIFPKPKRENFK